MTRWPLVLGSIAVLSGCTLRQPEPVTEAQWARQRQQLLAVAAWQAQGRVAFRSGAEGGQGSLRWSQSGEHALIRLWGPFGAGAYEVAWAPGRLTVTSKDGRVAADYSGTDAAEQFLQDQLGWRFPAVSARYWLLGVPDPANPAVESTGADGRVLAIEQHGWSVRYEDYVESGSYRLPRKIVMEGHGARLRLVIDRWVI